MIPPRSLSALLLVSALATSTPLSAQDRSGGRLGVQLDLTEVADSGSYSVYRYLLANPVSSSWSISGVVLDVGATQGTPPALPATGDFMDMTALPQATQPLSPYAQVGPISPPGWAAVLRRTAAIRWFGPMYGPFSTDSVAPGQREQGLGLRTTYFPGISIVLAEPTWQSCCSTVDPLVNEFHSTREFTVAAYSVAPRYLADEISLGLVQDQLSAACSDLGWIADATLCLRLSEMLRSAATRQVNRAGFTGDQVN